MYLPAPQHPSRPVTVKKLTEDNDSHWPPHKVRLKPLSRNTADETIGNNNIKNTVSKTQIHVQNNTTCENCDLIKLEVSYIFKIHNSGRRGHREREREYTYCFAYLSPPPYSILTRPD